MVLVVYRVALQESFLAPRLRCTTLGDGKMILAKIYERECVSHIRGQSLATMALRKGYHWPTLQSDAIEMVRKYDKYQ